jgi:hypothetical protein
MDISKFLREYRFKHINIIKRVTKEGNGNTIQSSCLIKVDMKIFRSSDGVRVDVPPQSAFRISAEQLKSPETSFPGILQAVITMRVGEEAWIKVPAGIHQENDEAWEDLWYQIRVMSIEPVEIVKIENWKFLREHRIGPNKVLKKRVVYEGYGLTPKCNSLVTYYYTVLKINGQEFEVYTNKCHVLPRVPTSETPLGIYYALLTMREGEECYFLLPPGYYKPSYKGFLWVTIQMLYINECSNAKVPQDQVFIREEDLGEGIIKRLITEGEGKVLNNVSKIWLRIEGWLEDSYQFQKPKKEVICYNKEGKIYGKSQTLALETVKRGEKCLVRSPPGTHLYDNVLTNETLWLEFTVLEYLDHLPDPNYTKDIQLKLSQSELLLESANRLFRSDIIKESKIIYNKIKSAFTLKSSVLKTLDAETVKKINNIKSRVLSNLALVHLKDAEDLLEKDAIEKNLKKVFEFCDLDQEINPGNVKTLYRRAKAFFIKNEFEKARDDILKALSVKFDSGCKELLKEIDVKLKGEVEREKSVFRKVFKEENWEKEEQEHEKWIRKLQTGGLTLNGIDSINLLMN